MYQTVHMCSNMLQIIQLSGLNKINNHHINSHIECVASFVQ